MFGRMRRVRINWLVSACVALLLLTVLAGVLQYRGINRWSNAVRRQRREVMERTLRNFSGDFRATLLQLLPLFRPPPDERADAAFEPYMIESARRWHSTSDRGQCEFYSRPGRDETHARLPRQGKKSGRGIRRRDVDIVQHQ